MTTSTSLLNGRRGTPAPTRPGRCCCARIRAARRRDRPGVDYCSIEGNCESAAVVVRDDRRSSQATVSSARTVMPGCPLERQRRLRPRIAVSDVRAAGPQGDRVRGPARLPDERRPLVPPSAPRPVARRCQSASRPVLEQLQGCVHALGEELIGQVALCQRSGELQGADHQSEEREGVRSSSLGVCRV